MYKCSICRKTVPPRTSCIRITKTHMYQHPYRPKAQKKLVYDKTGKLKTEWVDDKGGVGPQIVSEHPVCPSCAARTNT